MSSLWDAGKSPAFAPLKQGWRITWRADREGGVYWRGDGLGLDGRERTTRWVNGLGTAWPAGPSFVSGTGLVAILGYARPVSLWGVKLARGRRRAKPDMRTVSSGTFAQMQAAASPRM